MKIQYILRTVVLLIGAVSFTWMVKAQDQTPDERLAQSMADSIAMNKALKETIADKERLIERQNSQSEELQNELRNFSGMQNVVLLNKIEDTAKVCKSLEEECEALIITCNRADSVIAALNCELEPLRPFRESQLTEKMEYTEDWASTPFSELDTAALQRAMDECERYRGSNIEFERIAGELRQLQQDLQVYAKANNLIKSHYDKLTKEEVHQQLTELIARYENKPQKTELIVIDNQLHKYDGCIQAFQRLINKINEELKDSREKANSVMATAILNICLDDMEQKNDMQETRIIPYLSALLDKYVEALKKDPLQHWIGEEKVLKW